MAFADFRAEGAFLVTASRHGGKTKFVTVRSLAGEPLRIKPGFDGDVYVQSPRSLHVTKLSGGGVEIDLAKGETVTIFSEKGQKADKIGPVQRIGDYTPWGEIKSLVAGDK